MYNPETSSRVTLASLGTVFQTALSVLSRLRLSRHVQNLSRITRMRRICSFHGFFSFGFVCACRALGSSLIYLSLWTICGLSADFSCYMQSSAVQAQIQSEGNPRPSKSKNKKKSVKKIKSVASELSVSYFERVRTEPKAKEQSTNS